MPKRDTLHRVNRIDVSVEEVCGHPVAGDHDGEKFEPVLVDVKVADAWLKDIEGTLSFEGAPDFDWNAMRSALRYIVSQPENPHTGKLWLIVRTNRDVPRTRRDGGVVRFTNSPDTSQREGKIARELSSGHTPTLMMLRQNGRVEKGWADCPFWWPVLMAPKEMKPVVFAEDVDGPDEYEVAE